MSAATVATFGGGSGVTWELLLVACLGGGAGPGEYRYGRKGSGRVWTKTEPRAVWAVRGLDVAVLGWRDVTTDTKWIIGTVVGTGLAIVTAVLTVAGLMLAQFGPLNARIDDVNARIGDLDASMNARIDDLDASVNARIDDLNASVNARIDDLGARMDRIEIRLDAIDARLRNVEVEFGKVDQRLLTIERVVLPSAALGE